MTRSNRVLNRIVLALVGILAIAAGALAAWSATSTLPAVADRVPRWPADDVAGLPLDDTVLGVVVAVAVLLVVIAIAWIATRGRGRTSTAIRVDGIEVDIALVEQLLREELGRDSEVIAVSASAHRVRRRVAVRIRVDARRGAELRRLANGVRTAVDRLDAALGAELPVLVHVTSKLRASLAREHRAV